MFRARLICLLTLAALALGLVGAVQAVEVDCDTVYCFSTEDFAPDEERITGICITELPDAQSGTVMLGTRVLRCGDILAADQLAQMTFSPLRTEEDASAVVTYLPIYSDRVEKSATMTISIRGKEDKAPVAEDMALETYKNLANEGKLKVSDPEGQSLTYTVTRQPKRGEITVNADGTFVYTPKKNKVGTDSFIYTATDPAGHVSREATVTIRILKPTDAKQYTDTAGRDSRFAAEWMRHTGLFVGEQVSGQACFCPDKAVSRGQFLAMVVEVLGIPTENMSLNAVPGEIPDWLKPYYAAALRSGLLADLPATESGSFEADQPITGGEAAVMLQNALDLSGQESVLTGVQDSDVPAWAADAMAAMSGNGIALSAGEALTREQAALALYTVSKLADSAPGMAVIRMQK